MMTAEELQRSIPSLHVSRKRTYREITTLGVGSGVLDVLAEPESMEELALLLRKLKEKNVPFFVFGAGSNLAGMDGSYPGVGIRLSGGCFAEYHREGNSLRCGAYVRLPALALAAAREGLAGLGKLSGIPGSLGGALRMNAGARGATIGALVRHVSGITGDGRFWEAEGDAVEWFYRGNSIPGDVIVTEAVLQLDPGDPAALEKEIAEEAELRRSREPSGRSAGCAFRNVSELEPAGQLIDLCGLRGFRVGDLIVSEKHANYLINLGNATEADYERMIRIIRRAVAEKFGFYLHTEIESVRPGAAAQLDSDTPAPLINVLCGGVTSEREVSLRSGAAVAAGLRNAGFRVELSDVRECRITPSMREADVVYPALHGGFGEGGGLQKLLEKERIRFVGSGSAASELVMDKIATKRLLDSVALPTARWTTIRRGDTRLPDLQLPLILKVPCEGSSVGVVKVDTPEKWESALDAEFRLTDELLVEEFITGTEITVPILNGNALDAIEIVSPGGFYDWDAKYVYKNGHTEYFCPPRKLPKEVVDHARELALKFYHAARCRDLLRVDFIVTPDGVPMILEGNSLPGNTATSLVPKAARKAGMSMEKMTSLLVYAAMKRSSRAELEDPDKPCGVSRSLLNLCRWMFRLVLLLCAVLLVFLGVQALPADLTGVALILAAVLLLIGETVFRWLKSLEKR